MVNDQFLPLHKHAKKWYNGAVAYQFHVIKLYLWVGYYLHTLPRRSETLVDTATFFISSRL